MDLTNKFHQKSDQSISLSKYLSQDEKKGAFTSQISCRSDTQLLESSPIQQNSSFCISSEQSIQRPFILKSDEGNNHFSDFGIDFQIGSKCQNLKQLSQSKADTFPLDKICSELVYIVKSLQTKLEKIQEKQDHQAIKSSKTSTNMCQGSFLQSIQKCSRSSCLTKQSRNNCCNHSKDHFMQVLLQLIQTKGQVKAYQELNQKLQKQIIENRCEKEQLKGLMKKSQAECFKLRQLLKQYKTYHRKKRIDSQVHKTDEDFENSLDKRLKESVETSKQGYISNKYTGKNILDSVNTVISKETPKTPHHFRYHSCKNLVTSQKTQERIHNKSPKGVLKQIIEFQQRAQRSQLQKTQKYKADNATRNLKEENISSPHSFGKYMFNQLLELQNLEKEQISDTFELDHFSTMESLPEPTMKGPVRQYLQSPRVEEKTKQSLRKTKSFKNFQQFC